MVLLFLSGIYGYGIPVPEGYLQIDASVFLDIADGVPGPLAEDEAMVLLAEEAAWLARAMIYGFSFIYRPGDRDRGAAEEFELVPLGVPVDTRGFELPVFHHQENRLSGRFVYRMKEWEQRRYLLWYSNIVPESQGRGTAPLEEGYQGRIGAHEAAIHNALFAYFRTLAANKPRLIQGEVAVSSSVVSGIDGGDYVSALRVRIRRSTVTGYEAR
ncbi:MAG: hypothetical protein JXB03_07975 [Spirochaetales bacterium]|nr:hypothetical protein [Spirochaetales bacterium]